ncbi:hypothetical protein MKX01_002222 [Papaver californicum]|nr:hypothetical protein MKX01_002222 [Papaver californicum]
MEGFSDFSLKLLQLSGYGPEIQILFSSSEDPLVALQVMVGVARIIHLDEAELYFGGVEAIQPYYSPRNELESLNSVLKLIDMSLEDAAQKKIDVLLGEDDLVEWGRSHGVQTKLQIAYVEGAGRGAVAVEDLEVGESDLEIPLSIIIFEDIVYESDMYHILEQVDGISTETMLLLWSMKERYNSNSKFKLYFETLPEAFNTGLSFGIEALTSLDGTLLFEEIIQAKEHLRTQYDELCPALCSNHPDLCPHILNYGRVDSATNSLKVPLSRPCLKGEQCYLSYGKLSCAHLITFYDIDGPEAEEDRSSSDWTTHMVRGTWLSSNHEIFHYGLPPPLLNKLCIALSGATDTHKDVEIEKEVLETLYSIFNPMLEGLGEAECIDRVNLSWDVKLALEYNELQRKIISSVLASCSCGLKML